MRPLLVVTAKELSTRERPLPIPQRSYLQESALCRYRKGVVYKRAPSADTAKELSTRERPPPIPQRSCLQERPLCRYRKGVVYKREPSADTAKELSTRERPLPILIGAACIHIWSIHFAIFFPSQFQVE